MIGILLLILNILSYNIFRIEIFSAIFYNVIVKISITCHHSIGADMPGPTELIVVLLIVVVLFGASKLPELGKGLGKGIKEFKNASKEINNLAADENKSDT